MSLVELITAFALSLLGMALLVMLARFSGRAWERGTVENDTKQTLALLVGRLEPLVREARRVNVAGSSATRLSVVLPRVGADGVYVLPLADGDTVLFYLSNTTGALNVAGGTVLWRAVNGVPDAGWSLRGNRPVVNLQTGSLSFAYLPSAADPRSVRVSVSAALSTRIGTTARAASAEVFLRNQIAD